MATYNYTDGDGLAGLDKTTPVGGIEFVSILDEAIRQIKSYLKDPIAGAAYLTTRVAAIDASLSLIQGTVTGISPSSGIIQMTGSSTAPAGWLLCDGSAVSRTGATASLFAAIGITYGTGNGTTTFNIPDFRGRFAVQPDGGSNRNPGVSLGNGGGAATHTLTTGELPAHDHTNGIFERVLRPPYSGSLTGNDFTGSGTELPVGNGDSAKLQTVGSNLPHNNLPPYLSVNYIIKI